MEDCHTLSVGRPLRRTVKPVRLVGRGQYFLSAPFGVPDDQTTFTFGRIVATKHYMGAVRRKTHRTVDVDDHSTGLASEHRRPVSGDNSRTGLVGAAEIEVVPVGREENTDEVLGDRWNN